MALLASLLTCTCKELAVILIQSKDDTVVLSNNVQDLVDEQPVLLALSLDFHRDVWDRPPHSLPVLDFLEHSQRSLVEVARQQTCGFVDMKELAIDVFADSRKDV